MNSNPHNPPDNPMNSDSGPTASGEDTLRLIAGLPAPAGLEERVHQALRRAPRMGKVVAWPAGMSSKASQESNWMRAAAAAAIVFVVVGGGWGVYTRVEQGQSGKVVVMPLRAPGSGGFSPVGAIRTPVTLPGPKISEQKATGAKEQETRSATKTGVPKKHGPQPAATSIAPSQVAPQPAVVR